MWPPPRIAKGVLLSARAQTADDMSSAVTGETMHAGPIHDEALKKSFELLAWQMLRLPLDVRIIYGSWLQIAYLHLCLCT